MNRKVFSLLLGLAALFLVWQSITGLLFLYDGKIHVVFCDVGQGDALLIKSPEGQIVTLDGGPNSEFVSCLSHFLPLWSRHITLMMVTHPHIDHFLGYLTVIKSYKVDQFSPENLTSDQKAYQLLLSLVRDKGISHKILKIGDQYTVGSVHLTVLGPSEELLSRSSPNGQIGESKEFASLLLLLEYKSLKILLPGDSQAAEIQEAVDRFNLSSLTILQSPHHGSSTGLTESIMSSLQPKLGIISVGANNRYGHPSASTLALFKEFNVPLKRTDQQGTIEITSDGKAMQVRTER